MQATLPVRTITHESSYPPVNLFWKGDSLWAIPSGSYDLEVSRVSSTLEATLTYTVLPTTISTQFHFVVQQPVSVRLNLLPSISFTGEVEVMRA